jgi:hypothetical protein
MPPLRTLLSDEELACILATPGIVFVNLQVGASPFAPS